MLEIKNDNPTVYYLIFTSPYITSKLSDEFGFFGQSLWALGNLVNRYDLSNSVTFLYIK